MADNTIFQRLLTLIGVLGSPAQAGEASASTAGLALDATLGSPAQAGEASAATAGLALDATLGSPAQAGEAASAASSITTALTDGSTIVETRQSYKRINFSKANDDGTAITLDTGILNGEWDLISVRILQSGGTSTTSQYAMAEVSTATPPDINTIYRASSTTAKGTGVYDSFVGSLPCTADASGYLYMFSGRDANNDSTFAGVVWLRKVN